MTSRRGFLGALGALVAGATLDSERLLWTPKLISIPPVIRRPELRQFAVDIELDGWEDVHHFHDRYVVPALASLANSVEEWTQREGRRDPVFLPLELPRGLAFACRYTQNGVHIGRVYRDYDIRNRKTYCRADCLVYA